MTPSKAFLYLCFSSILGIFLSSFIAVSQAFCLGILILGILPILIFWRRKRLVVVGFCLVFFIFGIWHYQAFKFKSENNELISYITQEKSVTLIGIVDEQPGSGEKSIKLKVQPENIEGKILITTWKYPQYEYGDKIEITGTTEEPIIFEDFNYKEYLAKDEIYAVMYFPKIELIDKGFGNPVMKQLFSFRNRVKDGLNRIIPYPQSGLLEGLMFGDEDNIPKSWKEKFNLTGTRHITAVSGMNTTIISSLVFGFLLALGFWRNQAFYFSVILIFFYILTIGFPASAIRAGIMGTLFLTAQHFGRISNGFRTIVFAATFMLFLNPLLLKSDVGFQLSFLATLGLVLLQPIFLNILRRIPDKLGLRYALASTLSAQFFTLPILIYNFGQIPLIGPLANVLIVPLLAPITIFGFIFSFTGLISYSLGQILSFPLWLVLTYIFKIIDWSSEIPFGTLSLQNVSFLWVLTSYLLLAFVVWRLQRKQKLMI